MTRGLVNILGKRIILQLLLRPKKQKRERVRGSVPDHEEDSSPPAPTWCGNLNAAANFLEALHKHPFASNSTFLTSRS
jgi:hypothetical protein